MTNAFILCDLLWKVQKGHAVNRKGSFKWIAIQCYSLELRSDISSSIEEVEHIQHKFCCNLNKYYKIYMPYEYKNIKINILYLDVEWETKTMKNIT